MKNKTSNLLKQIVSLLGSIARAKSIEFKSKTSALKAMMKSKKLLMGPISHKIHGILGTNSRDGQDNKNDEVDDVDHNKAIVLYYNATAYESSSPHYSQSNNYNYSTAAHGLGYNYYDDEEDDKYPDLRHSLFDDESEDPGGSIIDLVKKSKEGGGEDFKLEDEIDDVADLFILRFHKQMRLQKLDSFKRYQEMLQRSA